MDLPVVSGPVTGTSVSQGLAPVKYAVIYLRVSTAKQAKAGGSSEGFSIPAQRDFTIKTAHSLGAFVVKEFVDAGASGTNTDRSALQALLSYISENSVDYVIVHKLDRLARNRADDSFITTAITEARATLVSSSESIDPSPGGQLVHGIMASIAEFYSRNLSNEVLKGMNRKHREGGTVTKAPIGYRNIGVRGSDGREYRTVEIDETRARMVRWAFHTYAAGKTPLSEITRSLNFLGLRASRTGVPADRPLSISVVHRMLRNPYYIGTVTWRGIPTPGVHEPLIEDWVWQSVQTQLTANQNMQGARTRHPHHLSGILKCGECSSSMYITHTRSKSRKVYPYFFCGGRNKKRTDCMMRSTLIAVVETLVEELYRQITITPEQDLKFREELERQQTKALGNTRDHLQTEARSIAVKQGKILDAYYAEAISLEALQIELERLTTMKRSSDAESRDPGKSPKHRDALEVARLRVDAYRTYCEATLEQRHAMHRALFRSIYLHRNDLGTLCLRTATSFTSEA